MFILYTGRGTCMYQANLFMNLCRLAGIQARERRGTLLARDCKQDKVDVINTGSIGYSPFVHTWAEVWSGSEWIPAEFIAWGMGRRSVLFNNVPDENLRATLNADTPLYDSYYLANSIRTGYTLRPFLP